MVKVKKSKPYTETVCVRLTREQKEILDMIAEYGGTTTSDLVRSLILELIYKFKMGIPIKIVEVREDEDSVSLPESKEG